MASAFFACLPIMADSQWINIEGGDFKCPPARKPNSISDADHLCDLHMSDRLNS
jgi:hypothetical protein